MCPDGHLPLPPVEANASRCCSFQAGRNLDAPGIQGSCFKLQDGVDIASDVACFLLM